MVKRNQPLPSLEHRTARIGLIFCLGISVVWAASLFIGYTTAVTILTVAGLAATLIGLVNPTIGLFGIGILCTLDPFTRTYLLTGGLLRWNTFNYLLLLMMVANIPTLIQQRDIHTRTLQALTFLMGIQLVYSADFTNGILSLLNIISVFGLTLVFRLSAGNNAAFLWLGMTSGLCATFAGVLFQLQVDRLPYINPNAYSYVPLAGLFAVCIGFRFAPQQSRSQLALAALAMSTMALCFLSTSRGAMLISLACFAYLILQTSGFVVRFAVGVMTVLIAAATFLVFSETGGESLRRVTRLLDDDLSAAERTSGRSDMALAGVSVFLENPMGVGTGGFKHAFSRMPGRSRVTGKRRNAHSAWVMTLAENGAVGFLLLLFYVSSYFFEGWRLRNWRMFDLGLLLTLSIAATFVTREFQGKGVWMLAAAGTILMSECSKMDSRLQAAKTARLAATRMRYASSAAGVRP